jgi:hypothetical protein
VAKGLLDRGLMRLDTSERLPRPIFTETGIDALRHDERPAPRPSHEVRSYPAGTRHRSNANDSAAARVVMAIQSARQHATEPINAIASTLRQCASAAKYQGRPPRVVRGSACDAASKEANRIFQVLRIQGVARRRMRRSLSFVMDLPLGADAVVELAGTDGLRQSDRKIGISPMTQRQSSPARLDIDRSRGVRIRVLSEPTSPKVSGDSVFAATSSDAGNQTFQAGIVMMCTWSAAQIRRLAELERSRGLKTRYRGKPPSSDGLNKPPRVGNLGGTVRQEDRGRLQKTLWRIDTHDLTTYRLPSTYAPFDEPLTATMETVNTTRQVFHLPEMGLLVVTESGTQGCRTAAHATRTPTPCSNGVTAQVQYAQRFCSSVPGRRLATLITNLFGATQVAGSVTRITRDLVGHFEGFINAVRCQATAASSHVGRTMKLRQKIAGGSRYTDGAMDFAAIRLLLSGRKAGEENSATPERQPGQSDRRPQGRRTHHPHGLLLQHINRSRLPTSPHMPCHQPRVDSMQSLLARAIQA